MITFLVGERVYHEVFKVYGEVLNPDYRSTAYLGEPSVLVRTEKDPRIQVCWYKKNIKLAALQNAAAPKEDLHQAGKKDDSGKVRIDLILNDMPRALLAVAEVATFGAKKYTEGGWLTVPEGPKRYRAALQRHTLAENIDEAGYDPETKLRHAAHTAWNALARLELLIREDEQKSCA
ncbi:endolysin; inhibits RNA polymerase [Ralstonia phage RSB3]|uniref:dATP/dGTP diphosphohydrolase N-terminal domain-containing protein n=1 Tax=Ralstonia phage RSB3 TaxID=1402875 RepID=U3TJZ2_9CAUD|nr:endolysin; inhibits RNA polymerase [Ralstonia phage RSB3]BAN92335.1 hypothetical protein [Ralstonia phage RSB3]